MGNLSGDTPKSLNSLLKQSQICWTTNMHETKAQNRNGIFTNTASTNIAYFITLHKTYLNDCLELVLGLLVRLELSIESARAHVTRHGAVHRLAQILHAQLRIRGRRHSTHRHARRRHQRNLKNKTHFMMTNSN